MLNSQQFQAQLATRILHEILIDRHHQILKEDYTLVINSEARTRARHFNPGGIQSH